MNARAVVPDFELPATGNQRFPLSAFRGHPVVLYFYPKDDTPGCTREGADFRDAFELLSDAEEKACSILGVMKMKNLYGRQVRGIERSTFVIDREGRIAREWRGVKVPNHAREVLGYATSAGL